MINTEVELEASATTTEIEEANDLMSAVNPAAHLFPFSIVWTPIPLLSWLFPFIGHMGIGKSDGVIRDFAGSYFVSQDDMAFGWPTLFWQLSVARVDRRRVEVSG